MFMWLAVASHPLAVIYPTKSRGQKDVFSVNPSVVVLKPSFYTDMEATRHALTIKIVHGFLQHYTLPHTQPAYSLCRL